MGIGITRLRHVKLPVTDLGRSVRWYAVLLGLEIQYEFVEQGDLRGVQLIDRGTGVMIALRLREFCASQPSLAGFDPVAFGIASPEDLKAFAAHCDALGVRRTEIRDAGPFGSGFDVTDPDETVLRFLCESPQAFQQFIGVIMDAGGQPELYHESRFDLH